MRKSIIPNDEPPDDLSHLRAESLRTMALCTGAVSYGWLVLLFWPITGGSAPPSAWIGALLLLSTAMLALLRNRPTQRSTRWVFILGTFGATLCTILALHDAMAIYLFILPIIFASVLLNRWSVFLLAAVSIGVIPPLASEQGMLAFVLPMAIIALVTLAAWLSAHNLYSTLSWLNNAYSRAHHNEWLARERQAELQQALKELHEARYRTERMNYMLNLARDQAEEARRIKQNFVQTISHELRTPLNLVVGFTELMVQSPEYYGGQLPPAYLRDLHIIHRNASHLQTLVNDVLDLARIETAQMSLLPELTDPAALTQEAVATARSLVESRGLTLTMEIAPDLPTTALDPTRIRQVLFNLLNNAARFTEQGGVTVRVACADPVLVFSVTDTGIGIAPADLPHIFDEFYQVDGSTRRRHGGAGLGLAISQRFVRLHGGQIWVESQLDQGSSFYFTLPLNPRDEPATLATGRVSGLSPWRYLDHGKKPILLVVTASTTAAMLLTRYIQGYRIVVANNLLLAAQLASQSVPQAVVIDTACTALDQPRMIELAQQWGVSHVPMIGCALPGEEPLRQRLAVDGYLIKPVLRQSLWDMLQQFGDKVASILVVDDNRDFVRFIRQILTHSTRQFQVATAHSGQEALAILCHRQPDLILLDLILPDLNGIQIIEILRSTPDWQEIPIVIVSAQDEIDNLEVLQGGFLITKASGLLPGQLVQWIQQVVDNATARSQPVDM